MQDPVKLEQKPEAASPAMSLVREYGPAVLWVGLALLLRFLLDPLWKDRLPFATFFLASIVVMRFSGRGPSIFAIIAGFILATYFYVSPRHSFLIGNRVDQINAVFYFAACFTILFFSQRARRALEQERSARVALSKLTAIIESSDDAIIGKSLEGEIQSWNAGATRLYGYSEAEALGKTIDFLLPPERQREIAPLLERVARGEYISHFETTRWKKNGELVDISLTISPVRDSAGRIVGASTIGRDISEQKRAERERERLLAELQKEVAERKEAQRALQKSQELALRQERVAAVGQLAAGLAHEFNNILTIIQGHASLLLDKPTLDEDSVNSVTHITDGVERTAGLVKQMLAFSRKQVMQQKTFHLHEILDQIGDMLGRLLASHVTLRIEVAPHLAPIKADPGMLQQIIVNLVINARDAMSDGGQLTIRAAEARFTAQQLEGKPDRRAGHFVQLGITDTGTGIDSEAVNHLFEPFYTTRDVGKGSGLGLATVHGMVNQNSGWIEVESAVGRGTTFNIYFPLAEMTAPKHVRIAGTTSSRRGGETILVVEDEPALRELLRELLEAEGYKVLDAPTGPDALVLWQKDGKAVDLLLADMSLPDGMSGRELAAKLQAGNPQLPVIFSSGFSQDNLEKKAATRPGQSFLSKPFHPSDLSQAVRAALDSTAASDPSLASPNSQTTAL